MVGDPTAFFYTSAKLDAAVVTNGGSGSNHFTELAFTSLLASQGFIWKLRVRIENLLSLKQFLKLGDPFFKIANCVSCEKIKEQFFQFFC